MAKRLFCEHNILISSWSENMYHSWRNFRKAFLRSCFNENGMDRREVTMTLMFDHQSKISGILAFRGRSVLNLKKLPLGWLSHGWPPDWPPDNVMPPAHTISTPDQTKQPGKEFYEVLARKEETAVTQLQSSLTPAGGFTRRTTIRAALYKSSLCDRVEENQTHSWKRLLNKDPVVWINYNPTCWP